MLKVRKFISTSFEHTFLSRCICLQCIVILLVHNELITFANIKRRTDWLAGEDTFLTSLNYLLRSKSMGTENTLKK